MDEFLHQLGLEYLKLCVGEYGKALRVLGSNLMEFFSNLDGLHEHIKNSPRFSSQFPPSFRCEMTGPQTLRLHYYTFRRSLLPFVAGTVEGVANVLFNSAVRLKVSSNQDKSSPHHIFFITSNNNDKSCKLCGDQSTLSTKPEDSKLSVRTFCASFPFHVTFDRQMHVTQLGTALMKLVSAERVAVEGGIQLASLFDLVRPQVKMSFSAFLSRLNTNFVLRTKPLPHRESKLNGHHLSRVSLYLFIKRIKWCFLP